MGEKICPLQLSSSSFSVINRFHLPVAFSKRHLIIVNSQLLFLILQKMNGFSSNKHLSLELCPCKSQNNESRDLDTNVAYLLNG